MTLKIIPLLIFILFSINNIMAQGCSDAGFCTLAGFKPGSSNDSLKSKNQKLSLIAGNGVGDEKVYVFAPAIQYDNQLTKQLAIQAKLTANYASGNLGSALGLGDVFLAATFTPNYKANWKTNFIIGAKLPLGKSNLKEGDKPLPMQYQSSLGTIDLITGLAINSSKWLFAAAIQQPISNGNKNAFLSTYWNNSEAAKYPSGNNFKRKGDILIRAGYDAGYLQKWKFNFGLLWIYHLGNDTYMDGSVSSQPIVINGSNGTTLNGTIAAWYKVSNKFSFGVTAGKPIIARQVRPDGLTRKFVLSPEMIIRF